MSWQFMPYVLASRQFMPPLCSFFPRERHLVRNPNAFFFKECIFASSGLKFTKSLTS